MTSPNSDLKNIIAELNHLSLKRQQLQERKKIQCIFQELRNRAEFGQSDEAAVSQHEIESIDEQLKQLAERKAELQKSQESILAGKENNIKKKVSFNEKDVPVTEPNIFFVEPPPDIPAPTVILDVEKLPACPCRTQCPQCQQFIVTETHSSVSSVTWMVCFMTAMLGCVAGCCLIPFCSDKCKSTTHRCPKCRTSIRTIKKL